MRVSSMNTDKRNREDEGQSMEEGDRSKEKLEVNGGEAVTEEEVEEFFAILKRIHVAVKYFEKNDGKRWKPSFEKEDFEEINGDVEGEKKEDDCGDDNTGFDLNLDPPPDDYAV